MYVLFFIFLFIIGIIGFIASFMLRYIDVRLVFAIFTAIVFIVLSLACYDLEVVSVLNVNNTVVEHTVVLQSPVTSYICIGIVLLEVINGISLTFEILRKEVKV